VQRLEREKAKLEQNVRVRDKMLVHLQQRVAELFVKKNRLRDSNSAFSNTPPE
jgi:predicted nuclease with TOPRIM domain